MKNNKKLRIGLRIILATSIFSILLSLVSLSPKTEAIVSYPPAALLQPGDITTALLKDYAVTSIKIATSADVATNASVQTAITNAVGNTFTITAGEALNTNDAVWLPSYTQATVVKSQETATSSTDSAGPSTFNTWQTFTAHGTTLASTTMYWASTSGGQNYKLCTFGSVSSPCASQLNTASSALVGASGAYTINWNQAVTPGTRYVIGAYDQTGAATIAGSATSSILLSGEVAIQNNATSTNIGTWYLIPYETGVTSVFKTTAAPQGAAETYKYNNFVGFTNATTSALATATIKIGKQITFTTGLIEGAQYYLGNTEGSIGITAGTNSFKIGRAISTSSLLLIYQNP